MTGQELIMELTLEQGEGRETQVQPPRTVWSRYFQIRLRHLPLPIIRIQNKGRRGAGRERRPVVRHGHVWTIELAAASMPRPAIVRVKRVAQHSYHYWVYRPPRAEFDHCDWILDTFENPYRAPNERRWVIF